MALFLGCGLFDPREPRTSQVLPERCAVLTSPDSVVANIVIHYGRVSGLSCYGSLVDTGFVLVPDPQDFLEREDPPPNPFSGWNRNVEMSVTQTMASETKVLEVSFDGEYNARTTTTNPTTETRYYEYHLLVMQGSPADTVRYQGRAEVVFLQRTVSWSLVEWRDLRDGSGLDTWGSLRADFRR